MSRNGWRYAVQIIGRRELRRPHDESSLRGVHGGRAVDALDALHRVVQHRYMTIGQRGRGRCLRRREREGVIRDGRGCRLRRIGGCASLSAVGARVVGSQRLCVALLLLAQQCLEFVCDKRVSGQSSMGSCRALTDPALESLVAVLGGDMDGRGSRLDLVKGAVDGRYIGARCERLDGVLVRAYAGRARPLGVAVGRLNMENEQVNRPSASATSSLPFLRGGQHDDDGQSLRSTHQLSASALVTRLRTKTCYRTADTQAQPLA